MIDVKDLIEQPEKYRASQEARGEDASLVDRVVEADASRRSSIAGFEQLRAEQKAFGKRVAQAKGEEKQALLAEVKDLAARVKEAESAAGAAEARLAELQRAFPNLIVDGVPAGGEDDFVVLKEVGTPRDFAAEGFEPRDHLELGELLGAIDMERGAKVSGARFSFLKGVGARLELALMQLGLDLALENGFVPVIPPTLVRPETMQGTGFDVEHDDEIYRLERERAAKVAEAQAKRQGK